MSRQQSRSAGDGAIDPSLVQKKRARHRLVGAICLCILAAIIVPLVLESEPRPRDQELPIELAAPGRDADAKAASETGSKALTDASGAPAATGPVASATESQTGVKTVTPPTGAVAAPAGPPAPERADAATPAEAVRPDAPRSGSASQAAKQEAARQEAARQELARQEGARQEAAKAAAAGRAAAPRPPSAPPAPDKPAAREPDVLARLIERSDDAGGAAGKAAANRRFLVQIGAYSNVQSAKTASDRASQLGLRPYQETVKTAQGDWIRVRVGPFTSRQDAERAQQDLKRAGVTAAIIAL